MTAAILSRDAVLARARRDFAAGKRRDEHGFNWHAEALVDWLDEYDRLAAETRKVAKRREEVAA